MKFKNKQKQQQKKHSGMKESLSFVCIVMKNYF